MADTSLTIDADTKERLKEYRAAGHESWSDMLEGLMEIVPPIEDILDGDACSWEECDNPLWVPDTPERRGGIIQWWSTDYNGEPVYGNAYYCSPEHAAKQQEKIDEAMPTHPDKVIVGGHEEMRSEVEGTRFYIDGERKEISIDVPGAFGGQDSHGNEYAYEGEPVYIWNAGKVRHSGVVGDIIHEEAHTALVLDRNTPVEMENHPDEERREEWQENRAEADEA